MFVPAAHLRVIRYAVIVHVLAKIELDRERTRLKTNKIDIISRVRRSDERRATQTGHNEPERIKSLQRACTCTRISFERGLLA